MYGITRPGAFASDLGLGDRAVRAAVSVMTNIAEVFDCRSKLGSARFLRIARRSAVEVQSLLYAAMDIGHVTGDTSDTNYRQGEKAKALIGGLRHSVRTRAANRPT